MDLNGKRVLILGGTGTLGRALTKEISSVYPSCRITIFSRDEHKQAAMKREFPKCNYFLGDIRNKERLFGVSGGFGVIFHVAALKHVDILENNVEECFDTNVLGTINACNSALSSNTPYFVFSSTDKAVDPINTYGYCKGISEKILYDYNSRYSTTKFSVYRWGNVIGSQGSAIHYFAKTLRETKSVNVTSPDMTRFWLPIEWAVHYMLSTFSIAKTDGPMIPPVMKSANVMNVISAVAAVVGCPVYDVNIVGLRPGEKLHESMRSIHDKYPMSSENFERYTHDELVEMIREVL